MNWKLLFINILTLVRVIGTIILVPIYKVYGGVAVGILSFVCYLTDSIDGILARHWNVSTFIGSLFDGVADKLFTIINFVVLYLITPYALIPILFECLIVLIQFLKFSNNLNVQSNIIGKSKVWILAMCAVLTFLASDINSISFLSLEFRNEVVNGLSGNLYFWLLFPAILMELLTFISYILEIFAPKKIKILNKSKKDLVIPKLEGKNAWEKFKSIWLNPTFYNEHKNDANLKALWKLSLR